MADQPSRREEENAALALIPLVKEIAEFVRSKLPKGQHFGVLIPVKDPHRPGEVRIIALTSDRDILAPFAAQWALDVHRQKKEPKC